MCGGRRLTGWLRKCAESASPTKRLSSIFGRMHALQGLQAFLMKKFPEAGGISFFFWAKRKEFFFFWSPWNFRKCLQTLQTLQSVIYILSILKRRERDTQHEPPPPPAATRNPSCVGACASPAGAEMHASKCGKEPSRGRGTLCALSAPAHEAPAWKGAVPRPAHLRPTCARPAGETHPPRSAANARAEGASSRGPQPRAQQGRVEGLPRGASKGGGAQGGREALY